MSSRAQRNLCAHQAFARRVLHPKLELLADRLHAEVLRKDLGGDTLESLFPANVHQSSQQLRANSAPLVAVADEYGELCNIRSGFPAQTTDAENPAFRRFGVLVFRHQRDLAIIVVEANTREPVMGDALTQRDHMKIAEGHALFGQGMVEVHHQWLILGTNGTDDNRRAVLHIGRAAVLSWIGSNRELRQAVFGHARLMQHHARVKRDQPLGRREQRIYVDFLDPALFNHELAETNQQLLQCREINRRSPAYTFQGREDARALHPAARERDIQRRQGQRPVLENLHQLPAGAEQQHRTKLWIEAAAEDQFVSVEFDHRLHGHAKEMLGTGLFDD